MADFLLLIIVNGAADILITGISYDECNLISDALFERPAGVSWAFCDPVSGVTA